MKRVLGQKASLHILLAIALSSVSESSAGNNATNTTDGEDFTYFAELTLYLGILTTDKQNEKMFITTATCWTSNYYCRYLFVQ